jgi:glycosyltransferase involved in cell wall biosynthesis
MNKVALVFGSRIDAPTGASAIVRNFCNSKELFRNQGIELSVYSPDTFNTSIEIAVQKDIDIGFYKRCSRLIKKYAISHTSGAILSILVPYFRSTIVERYIAANNNDEIVFMHDLLSCYKYIKHRKSKKAKIVLVLHNNGDTFKMYREYYKTLERSFFYKYLLRIERKVLENVDKIVFSADYPLQNFLKNHTEFDGDHVSYVYNGLPIEHPKEKLNYNNKHTYEICCVGTICSRKGQPFIVEALHRILNSSMIPDVHFSIIGGGPIMDELEILSKQYAISPYITFYGSSDKVNEYLTNSDIFILPSLDEGFPISILEAMRAGLPIVSTKVAGIPEMIEEGYNGIFIEPSIEGVFDFIDNIDKHNWNKMGKNSRELFLKKFTLEKMIESYSNIFKSL